MANTVVTYTETIINGVKRMINPNPSTEEYIRPDGARMISIAPGRFINAASK